MSPWVCRQILASWQKLLYSLFFLKSGPFSSGFPPPSPLLSSLRSTAVFRIEIPTEKYLVSPLWTCTAFSEWCFKTLQCWQPSIGRPSFSKERHQWASNYRDIRLQGGTFNIAYNPKSTSGKILWELQNTMQATQEGEAKVPGEMDHLEAKKSRKPTLLNVYFLCAGHHHGYFTLII